MFCVGTLWVEASPNVQRNAQRPTSKSFEMVSQVAASGTLACWILWGWRRRHQGGPRHYRPVLLDHLRMPVQAVVPQQPISVEKVRAAGHLAGCRAGGLEGQIVRLFPLVIAHPAA